MKKVISLSYVLLVILGCETQHIIFKGPYFIRFTETASSQKESHSAPINIELHNAGPALDEDIIISYTISGDAREGIDYSIVGERGQVTIKQGDYFGNISVQLINNSNNILRSQDVIFTLQTVSTGKLQIGQGESAIGTIYTLTIVDDCILGGDYIGHRGSPAVGAITITSTDCETYTLSNWNINVFSTATVMPLKFVDNADNTLTIPVQEDPQLSPDLATIQGTGVVDPTTRNIIMTITLVDYTDQPVVTFTLTPN